MTALAPAPSTLVYLFADRLVPPRAFLSRGTRVPCKHVEVQTDKLATLLLAFAFWGLREEGLIELAIVTKKRWIFARVQVEVVPIKDGDLTGLEGVLVEGLGAEERTDVARLICRGFGDGSADPWTDVVNQAIRDAIASDCIAKASDEATDGNLHKLRPRCREIAALEDRFEHFTTSWDGFRSREPVLCEQLLDQCARALRSCTERYEP